MSLQLLSPYAPLGLPHRIVMAPMTRLRALDDGTPELFVADFYAQRAGAALVVTEGIWPHSTGQSEWHVPGLATDRHQAAWGEVTTAVHARGGRIVAQLMHGGRHGDARVRFDGSWPAGPSVVPTDEPVRLPGGGKAVPRPPRALGLGEIREVVQQYADAAGRAVAAGFDLVEIHGANSYLPHQFLADNTNRRTDRYGGSILNRIRFVVEVVEAVADRIGAERTALRLSPGNPQFGMVEDDPVAVYLALLRALEGTPLAYLHLTDHDRYPLSVFRPAWDRTLIANIGENRAATDAWSAEAVLRRGEADLVSFGRAFLTTPDLPARIALGAPANALDAAHLYTPGPTGYTTYPTLDELRGDQERLAC